MSLVGSLEDLGLADILQVVSLARKSGLLRVRTDTGEGRIAFEDGLVRAATLKGQPESLSGLLAAGGFAPAEVVEEAIECARETGRPRDEVVAGRLDLSPEGLAALRREHVERVVLEMFRWQVGEFSFDVRDDLDFASDELALPSGLNAQYLTMEATRLRDERSSAEEPELVLSGEGGVASAAADDPAEALALAAAHRDGESEPEAVPPASPQGSGAHRSEALVVIDPDLLALEWLKAELASCFGRIHIFSHCGDGVGRIRQYLARGDLPVVLVSSRAPADPLTGVDVADLVARLRGLAPRLPIVVLQEEGEAEPGGFEAADAIAQRPPTSALEERRRRAQVDGCGEALRALLSRWSAPAGACASPRKS